MHAHFTWQVFVLFLAFLAFVLAAVFARKTPVAMLVPIGLALWVFVVMLAAAGVGT